MLDLLEKSMLAQSDSREKKINILGEKYAASSKKREDDLARQKKELPAEAFGIFKVQENLCYIFFRMSFTIKYNYQFKSLFGKLKQ